jgi:segregation and condensation protein B
MSENYVRNVIEAALLAAGRPLSVTELAQLFDENLRPANDALRTAIAELGASYEGRGIEVKETAGGVRIQVRQEFAPEVSRLWPERPQRYSRALLETLALIAYRQPITRAEIESVRGVAVNPNILKTLMERNWVRVVGHRDVPGHPELLGTAREFLDYFGLKSLDDLPPLAELKAMGDIHMQLPLPGTAEGSGDEVALVAAPGEGDEPQDGESVLAPAVAARPATAADDEAGQAAAAGEAGDAAAGVDDLPGDDEFDEADDGEGRDEPLGVRIQAAALDDDGDADGDGDEREASGLEATGLVAAPPARDD